MNCDGVMGAGIAVPFKRKFPGMFDVYAQVCDRGLKPGDVVVCWSDAPGTPVIYCLATQDHPGPRARLEWIRDAVRTMLDQAEAEGLRRVGIHRVGSGKGGLPWENVREVPVELATPSPVELVVVTQPEGRGRPSGRRR